LKEAHQNVKLTMNPPPVETRFAMPDPNASPLNLAQLFTLANALVSSTITEPFVNIIVQNGAPSADDPDNKVWLELDTQGRPISLRIYWHGHWRRIYNGMPGEIRGFSGDPGYNTSGNFNPDGLGNVGGAYDGWHICNGKNGTPDLSNQFLCGANMNPPAGTPNGYDHGWQTLIDDKVHKGGGQWTEQLQPKNVPIPQLQQTFMDRYRIGDSGGETVDGAGLIWGVKRTSPAHPVPGYPNDDYTYPPSDYPGNQDGGPEALFIGPPFYSLAWIVFVGYA
jgi:hypothetical protein